MSQYSYDTGLPFGDPDKFTRSTGEDEIARFNDWMRSQPWWQSIRGSGTGDLSDQQQAQIVQAAKNAGITVPSAFHIDEAGNFNQKSRTKRNLIIAAAIGGGVLTAGLASGAIGAGLGGAASSGSALGSTAALGPVAAAGGTTAAVVPAGIAASTAGSGLGLAGTLGAVGKNMLSRGALDAAGRMVGAAGETAAQNRGASLEAALASDSMNLAAANSNREGEADAMKKLNQANYLQHWAAPTRPANLPISGLQGPTAPDEAQLAASKSLEDQMLKRIQGGGFQPSDYSQFTKPSSAEHAANYIGPALSLASLLYRR